MYKEVVLIRPDGVKRRALYDTDREILILNYVTTELAKLYGIKWEEVKDGCSKEVK